jgi:hypothetical protein
VHESRQPPFPERVAVSSDAGDTQTILHLVDLEPLLVNDSSHRRTTV